MCDRKASVNIVKTQKKNPPRNKDIYHFKVTLNSNQTRHIRTYFNCHYPSWSILKILFCMLVLSLSENYPVRTQRCSTRPAPKKSISQVGNSTRRSVHTLQIRISILYVLLAHRATHGTMWSVHFAVSAEKTTQTATIIKILCSLEYISFHYSLH